MRAKEIYADLRKFGHVVSSTHVARVGEGYCDWD
jgi:hypothetical protein